MPEEKVTEATLNIYQKLAKIRKSVEVVQKNKSGYGYKYVTDDELLARITGQMDKYGVSLIPSIVPRTFNVTPYTYQTIDKKTQKEKTVNELLVQGEMEFEWINNENPVDSILVPWVMVGHQSDASQSFGSALTYAYRYFILKYFGVATPEDDPDNWRSKQKAAEDEEDRLLTKQIIDEFDVMVRAYLANNQGKQQEVKDLVSRYVKNGDYTKIKEPALARKLMDDFMTKFGLNDIEKE